ncbi:DUF317 domain-containing protein [Streptomyces sp. NPDC059491]|uniref:DUF317 domain-containing protein n=1 Tax=Streptomyces sp. NPDC059491 TaxID=3346850 RepID=UPI003696C8CB
MELDEQARVLVSPRYLAGAGDRLTDVLGPLIHLFGWARAHDPETGHIAVGSPDGALLVNFSPGSPSAPWWTVTHRDPFWRITVTRQTPLEALAGITQALPQLLGDTRHADRIPLTERSVADIADLYGWITDAGSYTSPDGHCTVRHAAGQPWRVEHSVYEGFDTHWAVRSTGAVPAQLPAQFLTYLATPDPVERTLADVPYQARSEARLTPLANHRSGLGAHIVHALGGLVTSGEGRRR